MMTFHINFLLYKWSLNLVIISWEILIWCDMPGLGPLASSAQAGDLWQAQADKPSIDNHPPDKQYFIKTPQGIGSVKDCLGSQNYP